MNIEISAGLAWWFNLCGADNERYWGLVHRALATFPWGPRRSIHIETPTCYLRARCRKCPLGYKMRIPLSNWFGIWNLPEDMGYAQSPIRSLCSRGEMVQWKTSTQENTPAIPWVSGASHHKPRRQSFGTLKVACSAG